MYVIDNDYMVNERALDVRSKLKTQDNPSNISEIFFKQLALRLYDFILRNSVNFNRRSEVDKYIAQSSDYIDDFKRAMAEQALYIFSNGDMSVMLPDGTFDYNTWMKMRVGPAALDILNQLGFLRSIAGDQEVFYEENSIHRLFDPTRNW